VRASTAERGTPRRPLRRHSGNRERARFTRTQVHCRGSERRERSPCLDREASSRAATRSRSGWREMVRLGVQAPWRESAVAGTKAARLKLSPSFPLGLSHCSSRRALGPARLGQGHTGPFIGHSGLYEKIRCAPAMDTPVVGRVTIATGGGSGDCGGTGWARLKVFLVGGRWKGAPEIGARYQNQYTIGSSITAIAMGGWEDGCRSVTQPTLGKRANVVRWHSHLGPRRPMIESNGRCPQDAELGTPFQRCCHGRFSHGWSGKH